MPVEQHIEQVVHVPVATWPQIEHDFLLFSICDTAFGASVALSCFVLGMDEVLHSYNQSLIISMSFALCR